MWADASNWTGRFSLQNIADLKAAGVVGVIIQAVTGLDGISYTRQQLLASQQAGLRTQGYVWCTPAVAGGSVALTKRRLSLFDGFALEALWLDVEQTGLKQSDVDRDLPLCDAYISGMTGIYTGRWFFAQQGWANKSYWANRPLWDAHYDDIAQVNVDFIPYGGWTVPVVKQYRGTTMIGTVHEIDLDVAA